MSNVVDLPTQRVAVAVYEKKSCPGCHATKRWLEKRGITYTAVDISTDPTARAYVVDVLGYMQAPVIVLSTGEHWSGFQPDLLQEHLEPAA